MHIGSSLHLHQSFLPAAPPAGNTPSPHGTLPHDTDKASGTTSDKAADKNPALGEQLKPTDQSAEQEATENRLADEQVALIRQLKSRDREVRQHEAAHQAVGGSFAGAVSYTFQRGPDGVAYAVGGEVPIDLSPATSPEATIDKMDVVKAAAMAPAQPSPQDLQVAAAATQIQLEAKVQLAAEQKDPSQEARQAEPGSTEGSSEKEATDRNATVESGKAKNAASVYQRIGDFMAGMRPEAAGFEARA